MGKVFLILFIMLLMHWFPGFFKSIAQVFLGIFVFYFLTQLGKGKDFKIIKVKRW
jgi:hypothetical protein